MQNCKTCHARWKALSGLRARLSHSYEMASRARAFADHVASRIVNANQSAIMDDRAGDGEVSAPNQQGGGQEIPVMASKTPATR